MHDINEDSLQQVHHRLEEHRAQLIGENLLAGDETFSVELIEKELNLMLNGVFY